jgi:hypothetical protein
LKHKPTSTAVVKLSSLGFNVHEEARVNRQPEEKVKTCCEKTVKPAKFSLKHVSGQQLLHHISDCFL